MNETHKSPILDWGDILHLHVHTSSHSSSFTCNYLSCFRHKCNELAAIKASIVHAHLHVFFHLLTYSCMCPHGFPCQLVGHMSAHVQLLACSNMHTHMLPSLLLSSPYCSVIRFILLFLLFLFPLRPPFPPTPSSASHLLSSTVPYQSPSLHT